MRRAAQALREQQAMAAFHVAVARLLQTHGWIAMDRTGLHWAHGALVAPTAQALIACEEDELSAAWTLLVGDPS